MLPYRFETRGKNAKNYAALAGLALAFAGLIALGASIWFLLIVQGLAALILWDVLTDRRASLSLDASGLRWRSGRREEAFTLGEIGRLRLSRRLDFSHAATLYATNGQRHPIPWECLPPVPAFKAAAEEAGIEVETVLFSLV
ncbi:hypothetical protein PSA7680_01244 [Pseudoruegeria aquimaris]|uniref:Uncharacterized protein n=1 Tax=Pseudoruegeria aquimaris TaxID=393663 RepID=A0A1Y5S144_9RHOB|nr:hypothetical protein [Pseudoruegeria aquimaris]SLN27569.1 hypothetical protein PSA7680_01244 [Pseudoruegeria aquimaris]